MPWKNLHESTGAAPGRLVDARGRRARDWAALLGYGVLSAAFLARSAYGGSRAARRALLDRLALPADALPALGGWRADVSLLHYVADHVLGEKPRTIVELGSGVSTLVMARAAQLAGVDVELVSLDHDARFSEQTRRHLGAHGLGADLRVVPLVPSPGGWPGLWYDCGELPERIDLMLVDGPPWTVHPLVRGAAETLFGRLRVGGIVMLDDAARPGERVVARRWRAHWPAFRFERRRAGKGLLVGTRLR